MTLVGVPRDPQTLHAVVLEYRLEYLVRDSASAYHKRRVPISGSMMKNHILRFPDLVRQKTPGSPERREKHRFNAVQGVLFFSRHGVLKRRRCVLECLGCGVADSHSFVHVVSRAFDILLVPSDSDEEKNAAFLVGPIHRQFPVDIVVVQVSCDLLNLLPLYL